MSGPAADRSSAHSTQETERGPAQRSYPQRDHFVQFVSSLSTDAQVEALRPPMPLQLMPAAPPGSPAVQMAGATPSLEDRARDAPEWKDGRVTTHITGTGLSVDPWTMWKAAFKAMDTGDTSEFDALVETIPFNLPNGPLVLWSGEGAEDKAKAVGTDINSTDLGKLLKGLTIDSYNWPKQQKLWESISARFATAARNEVHIFLGISGYTKRGGVRPESVFGGTEKETIDKLKQKFPQYAIQPIYHCVVKDASGSFAEPIGPFTDPGQVPQPRSLFWATGKSGDIGKTNPQAHEEDPTSEWGTRPPTP